MEPAGAADELRTSLTDGFGTWAIITLWSPARFDEQTAELVAGLVPTMTAAVRRACAREWPTSRRGTAARCRAPSTSSPRGRACATPERPARAHVPAASGAWFSLDASPLDDERYGPVAIVMRPARREGVLDTRLRAFGLSQREREVAELPVQVRSAKEIALELVLSHSTVQDHLKRIYEKTSARGASCRCSPPGRERTAFSLLRQVPNTGDAGCLRPAPTSTPSTTRSSATAARAASSV